MPFSNFKLCENTRKFIQCTLTLKNLGANFLQTLEFAPKALDVLGREKISRYCAKASE